MTKAALLLWWTMTLLGWSPPERRHGFIPEARESLEVAHARYEAIAQSALDVAFDPNEKPLFGGPRGRLITAGLMLSVALTESGFRRDVDLGLGKLGRGDHGRSWCMMQLNIGKGTVPTSDPVIGTWTGPDLVADRRKCFRAGLHLMRRSFAACASLPLRNRLSAYASGACSTTETNSIGKLSVLSRLLPKIPKDWTDKDAQTAWAKPVDPPVSPTPPPPAVPSAPLPSPVAAPPPAERPGNRSSGSKTATAAP